MKLNYRGVSYEYNPPKVAVSNDRVVGKFRGLDWRFHNLKKPLVLQPPVQLTYRGVSYTNRPETATNNQNVEGLSRWLMLNKEKASKNHNDRMFRRTAHEVGLV